MRRLARFFILVCVAGVFLAAGGLLAQEVKKDPPAKVRGQLPPNWGKLGLSDEQKQKIYKIQGDYETRIDELEAKLKQLKQEQNKEMVKVLTDAQRARLKEIVTEKIPGEIKNPEEKK